MKTTNDIFRGTITRNAQFLWVIVLVVVVTIVGMIGPSNTAFAQDTGRPEPSELPMQKPASIQSVAHPPSYGYASASSQYYEYINVFTTDVDEENRTVTITVKVVVTTGEEGHYGSGEYVNVWIDFDGSGTFDSNEQVMAQLQFARAVGFRGMLTYTQVVPIPENAVVHTWTRASLGYGYNPGPTGSWTWGNSITKPITLGGEFEVTQHEPENNAANIDFDNLLIEVRFGRTYKESTVNENTFLLEYRTSSGDYQKVNGTIFHATNTIVRFRPNGSLKDGVYYRVTIKGGPDGVTDRGDPPAQLSADFQWRFSTIVDLTGKVRVNAYQVSRNEMLVPNKPTLIRIYAEWDEKPDVHNDSEVKEFRANVSVQKASGGTLLPDKENVTIKRPDQYTSADKKNARNSVNFYNWRPASADGSPVKVIIEPVDQKISPPRTYEGSRALTYWNRSPNLNFDYYFIKVGDWLNDVPAGVRASGVQLANAGGLFTTQNFPAVSTTGNNSGDFTTPLPETVIELTRGGRTRRYYVHNNDTVRVDGYVARMLYNSAIASGSQADIIVGLIPQNFQIGITGVAFNFGGGRRTVLIVQGSANASTVAHEFAHHYRQGHDSSDEIEGFRMASNGLIGWNKSKSEGNQEAGLLRSLMTPTIQPVNARFILNTQYRDLFNHIEESPASIMIAGLSSTSHAGWVNQGAEPYLIVSGSVNRNATSVNFDPVKIVDLESPVPPEDGPFTIELQDIAGSVLSSTSFDTLRTDPYHDEYSGDRSFHVVIPYNSDLEKIVVKRNNTVIGEYVRSENSPIVEILAPDEGSSWSGTQTVEWSGYDPDGDQIYYTLSYSPDGYFPWTPLLSNYIGTSYEVNTSTLRVGSNPTFRLIASDGLNTSEDKVSFTLSNDLAILSTYPDHGDTASVTSSIVMFFNTDIAAETFTTGSFTLQDEASQRVSVDVEYDEMTRSVTLSPYGTLQHDHQYTVTLQAGVSDIYGNTLNSNYSWTFLTEEDREPPQINSLFPRRGSINVNPASWIRIEFNEPLDPGSVNISNVILEDSDGITISGTVEYDSDNNTIVYKPASHLLLNTEYTVTLTTGITDKAGNPVETQVSWSFTTGSKPPSKGELNGYFKDFGFDADKDGIFEALHVEVGITLLETQTITLVAGLTDSTGNTFVEGDFTGVLDAGDHQLVLSFPGEAISFNGVGGVFILGPLYLFDSNTHNWTLLEYQENAYQTAPYDLDQFKKAGATLRGSYSDEGIDDDGDGLYDKLRIYVGLSINEPGSYRVRGQLYNSNGFYIQLTENSGYFSSTGDAEIALEFDGGRIRGHGDASPYELRYVDVFDNNNQLIDSKTTAYTTGTYSGEEFQFSPADLQLFADQTVLVQGDPSDNLITFRFRVFNFGGTMVDTTYVRIKVNNDPLLDDILMTGLTGVPQEISFPWDVSQYAGTVNVSLEVDPENLIEEIDKFNNKATFTVTLPVANFPGPPSLLEGWYENGEVLLSWLPPSGGWSGFYIYRSLLGDNDTFSRITFDPVSSQSYIDSTITIDTTYRYTMTSFLSGQPSLEGTNSGIIAVSTITSIDAGQITDQIPQQYALYPAYPNPFNPTTMIRYDVPAPADVKVEIFNILGQHIRTLVDEYNAAGTYTVSWDGQNQYNRIVASGVYLVAMQAKAKSGRDFVKVQKIVFVK